MCYEPSQILEKRREREFALTPAFGLTPEDLGDSSSNHFLVVAVSILQLACGGLDECHNNITPLSWDDGTIFGGPPVYDSPARQEATLLHCLVHLREGHHPGEFGTGYQNSGYWAGGVTEHPTMNQMQEVARTMAAGVATERERELLEPLGREWSSQSFVRACADAMRSKEEGAIRVCNLLLNLHLRLLLEHVLARAGQGASL